MIVFPSTAGTWRDPNNFGREWRRVHDELVVPDVTTHSFRKSVKTLIDDRGLNHRAEPDIDPDRLHDGYIAHQRFARANAAESSGVQPA
jgi:hypothetical protein